MTDQTDIPLAALFVRALKDGARAINMAAVEDATQELIASALADLRAISARVNAIGLFSTNETVDDLTARDMVYLFVPFVQAELQGRLRTTDPADRVVNLKDAQASLTRFCSALDQYDVVPAEDKALWTSNASSDPSQRRETKIKQYKNEKAVRGMIDSLRISRGQPASDGGTELDDILALLPAEGRPPSDDDDEGERKVTLLCLRYIWSKAQAQLGSIQQELELLKSIPPPPPGSSAPPEQDDTTWRLDPRVGPGRGPLLDSKGKPLQPFTILPAGATSDRQRLQSEVFRPDHRLPTMTIDEYLEEEQRRGNIITGGGKASLEKPTTSEQLAMDAEDDGTFFGETKAEEKRQKDENWAQYTDTHRKGAGNTMNRG